MRRRRHETIPTFELIIVDDSDGFMWITVLFSLYKIFRNEKIKTKQKSFNLVICIIPEVYLFLTELVSTSN